MDNHEDLGVVGEPLACPVCGSQQVQTTIEIDRFQYGDGPEAAMLEVPIPVQHCRSCGFAYSSQDASNLRHDAVCKYLGVLTPREVRAVREMYGMSQADFADITKIGKASLARWESGHLIQSAAYDRYLRLIRRADNIAELKRLSASTEKQTVKGKVVELKPKFRTIRNDELPSLKRAAEKFDLYLDCDAREDRAVA